MASKKDLMYGKVRNRKAVRSRQVMSIRAEETLQGRRFPLDFVLRRMRSRGWMMKALPVMLGGSMGALSRYGISLFAAHLFGTGFPFGTLIANLAGCFLIGLSFALADRGMNIMTPSVRLFFMTGFVGSFTTFSTFALETVNAVRAETLFVTAANFLSNNLIGGALVFLGMRVGGLK